MLKKDIVESNILLEKKRAIDQKNYFQKRFFPLSFASSIIAIIIFVAIISFTNESKIFDITVTGNSYFTDEDIIDLAKINDNFYLNIPFIIKGRLKNNPVIESANISFLDGNIINIDITEKKLIGYSKDDEGYFYVYTTDNKLMKLDENNTYLISYCPYINNLDSDKLEKLAKKMNELDKDTIRLISEISSYPFSYDKEMLELIMSDGNYCFVSIGDIDKVVEYFSITFNIDKDNGNTCIYISDLTIPAYTSTCPWQK